jgi:hypothetical protein
MRQQLCFWAQRYQEKLNIIQGEDDFYARFCRKCPAAKFGRVEGFWKTEMSEAEYENFLVDNPWLWQPPSYYY